MAHPRAAKIARQGPLLDRVKLRRKQAQSQGFVGDMLGIAKGVDRVVGASDSLRAVSGAIPRLRSGPRGPAADLPTRGELGDAALALAGNTPQGKGVGGMVALGPRIVRLRNTLGLPKGAPGIRAAREMNELADTPMLPLRRDAREDIGRLVEQVPVKSKFGQFVDDRTAIIQDPKTGRMFSAPGAIHGELIEQVVRQHPEFSRLGPRGWMQHEVYAGAPAFVKGEAPIPPRMMLGGVAGHTRFGEAPIDTPAATIKRATVISALVKAGLLDPKQARAMRAAAKRR